MRVALAGVSHWHAGMHLDAARHAGAAIASVWDPDPAITAAFAGAGQVAVSSSLAALLDERPDLVVVMGHPGWAPMVARAVLATGIPMMLEKPVTATSDELESLRPPPHHFVAVPLCNRCSPIWPELARLTNAGRAGQVAHAQFRIVNGPPDRYRTDGVAWLLDRAAGGGGALRNLGLHALDAALALFGAADPDIIGAQIRADMHGETVEDFALATLSLPGGPVITVEAGYTYASRAPGGDFEWRIAARGAYLIDRGDLCQAATLDDGTLHDLAPLPANRRYRAFMADTLRRLRDGAPPLVGFDDYLRAMRLADRIYERARP